MVSQNYKLGSVSFSLVFHYTHVEPENFKKFRSKEKASVIIELFESTSLACKLRFAKNKKDILANETFNELDFSIKTDFFKGKFDGDRRFKLELYPPYSKDLLVIRNAVRLCIGIYTLFHKKGIFLHSSSIVKAKCSSIFFGLPGSGKSTIARFAKETGFKIQGDEFIFISDEKEEFFSYATPFGGDFLPDVKKAKVKAIYSIRKGRSFKILDTKIEELIPKIVQNELVCMGTKIKGNMLNANLFYYVLKLCKHVGFGEIIFPYKKDFLKEIIR